VRSETVAGNQLRYWATLLRPRGKAVLGAALVFAAAGLAIGHGFAQVTFLLLAAVLGAAAAGIGYVVWRTGRDEGALIRAVDGMCAHDSVPTLLTDPARGIAFANPAAKDRLAAGEETTLAGALGAVLANAAPILEQLHGEAQVRGAARREIATGDGVVRLGVHRAGDRHALWRVETLPAGDGTAGEGHGFAMLSAAADDSVIAASPAAVALLGAQPDRVDALCLRPPLQPGQINEIRAADGVTACLVAAAGRDDGGRDLLLLPRHGPVTEAEDGWAFFDALPVPLLKLARDGTIQQSNRPARQLLGVQSGEGRRLGELLEGPGRPVPDWLDDAAGGRGTIQPETVRLRSTDSDAFVQVALTPAADNGKTVLVAVLHDATKLKSLEAQFVQSQKMQAIGQLAGGVAHDFNNLLTAISGHCDLLLLRHDAEDGDYADLMQISQNANRAAALVSQLLAYSRKQTLRTEIMDVRDMLSELSHLLNRLVGETVTLTVGQEADLWAVRADKRQLEQVLMNLVVNARDAMPEGGEIRITTENMTLATPLRRNRAVVAPGRYVAVRVADEGAGIAPDKLDKIFEPFFTTKRSGEGTGLGLSTVYGIVKQTGGFIFADSTPGAGTEFLLLLPAHDGEDDAQADAPAPIPDARAQGVVLLVEDEAPVRVFASRALKMRGLSVLEAETAEAALEILEDPDVHVDVFVTDVVMPGRDGPSWVREALAHRPGTSVVFVSGYAPDTLSDIRGDLPGAVFLPKPFSLTELTDTVRRALSG
jgi:two-component system cell cycle sensor histidine kinase/response regulator CckA